MKYKFLEFIKSQKNKQNLLLGCETFLSILFVQLLAWQIFYFTSLLWSNPQQNYILSVIMKSIGIVISIYLLISGFRKIAKEISIAHLLDLRNNDKNETFLNAFEIWHDDKQRDNEFSELIFLKADKKVALTPSLSDFSHLKNISFFTGLMIIFAIATAFLTPEYSQKTKQNYSRIFPPKIKHKEFVEVSPQNLQTTRNSAVEISVVRPEAELAHSLFYKIDDKWRQKAMPENSFTFHNLDFSIGYFVKNKFAVSDTFFIEVFDLPIIERLEIKYDYPDYTGMKNLFEPRSDGQIKAIENTKVDIKITANNNLNEARMIFSDGNTINLEQTTNTVFTTDFILTKNLDYHFQLTDFLNNKSRKITKQIEVIKDKKPEVQILYPAQDTLMTQNMLFPLDIFAADDFGIETIKHHFSLNYGEEYSTEIKSDIESSINFEYIHDMTNLGMMPGDKVFYWISVTDNSPQKQTVLSQKYSVRFPSIEEIYKEIEQEENRKSQQLSENLKKSKNLNKDFEKKRRDLMRKEKIDWEDKKELKDLLNRQENLKNEVDKLSDNYQDLIKKFQDNKALSKETIKKMEKIQELMEEISNEDLQKAMQEMQEAMKNIDKEVLQKAMENMKFSMDDYTKKLEQTIDLLESIKKEQNLQKSLEIAEEMQEMQSKISEETKSGNADSQSAENQKSLQEKLDALEKQLAKTDSLLSAEKDAEIKEMMKKLQEELSKNKLKNDLQQAHQDMQSGDMQKAQQSQQSAMQQMQQMMQQLQQMNSMMSKGGMQQTTEAIEKAINRLLIFSQKHQESKARYLDDPFVILKQQIANFEGINLTMNELYKDPQIVFSLTQKFMYDLNFLRTSYRDMFSDINDAKFRDVDDFLVDIQKGINLVIYDLMQSKNNMQSQGGGGAGMQQMMQMMQQMGQQQMAMNMLTQQLMQQMSQNGRLSNEMRGQLQRLARDEQRLADNIRRMVQNNQAAQQQASSLNKLADELEDISRQIRRNRIDQSLIDRQERILSRMLDAQKSIHKRNKSKKRKAEQSEKSWEIPETTLEKFEELRRKALLKEDYKDYPPEYQILIKEYLKLLNKKDNIDE